jgi:hypothetical protein
MKTLRVVCSIVIGLVALLGLSSSGHAYADSEVVRVFSYHDTSDPFVAELMTGFCGFTIMRQDDVHGRIVLRYNQSGDLVSALVTGEGTATFSANGKSITGTITGNYRNTFSQDGGYTYLESGHNLWIVLPGVGPAWGATGRLRLVVDAQGNVISERDPQENAFLRTAAVCAALAP